MTMGDMTKHAFVKISRENTIEVKLLKKIVFCKRYWQVKYEDTFNYQ